jgi:hypothetical protein
MTSITPRLPLLTEHLDAAPAVQVSDAEYRRLLGFPKDHVVSDRVRELMHATRMLYAQEGRPWTYWREANLRLDGDTLQIDETEFDSPQLRSHLRQTGAERVLLLAVSAGARCETVARQRWEEGKPDEYFFLEMFGSAVVEQLVADANGNLCALAEREGMSAVPHYSPGYTGWDVRDQPRLFEIISRRRRMALPEPLDVLASGMLRPKKSLLAVVGLAPNVPTRAEALSVPCTTCAFTPCSYRRGPYEPAAERLTSEPRHQRPLPATIDVKYTVNTRALQRWARERVHLVPRPDRTIDAHFRFDGTTCSNFGHPLAFEYAVTLDSAETGYLIRGATCRPAAGDVGHTKMCAYLTDGPALLETIAEERPLLGRPLSDALSWLRSPAPAGCYCHAESRVHKWGLALETIHYALFHPPLASNGVAPPASSSPHPSPAS